MSESHDVLSATLHFLSYSVVQLRREYFDIHHQLLFLASGPGCRTSDILISVSLLGCPDGCVINSGHISDLLPSVEVCVCGDSGNISDSLLGSYDEVFAYIFF